MSQPPPTLPINDEDEVTRLKAIPMADQQPLPCGEAFTAW